MKDLISRQMAIDEFYMATCDVDKVEWAENVLKRVPTAERKGNWENYLKNGLRYKCSVCGSRYNLAWNYCPNCGADMRERSDNGQND